MSYGAERGRREGLTMVGEDVGDGGMGWWIGTTAVGTTAARVAQVEERARMRVWKRMMKVVVE